MNMAKALPRDDAAAAVVEYALIIAVVSILLVVNLPALRQGFCSVGNDLGQLFSGASSACGGSGNGNGNGNGSGSGNGNGNGQGNGGPAP